MKYPATVLMICLLCGCAGQPVQHNDVERQACLGNVELPPELADKFEAVEDEPLLKMALGEPNEGGLCEGRVYRSKEGSRIAVYRAWNSTNPNSEKGNWWAFQRPDGNVSQYRSHYEICYQWSPLDNMVSCTLNAGVKIVVGTGQSARCSEYLTYPVSDRQQIYIDEASKAVSDCVTYNGEFSWKKLAAEQSGIK